MSKALRELLAQVEAGEASCIRSMAHKAFGGRPYTFPKGEALWAGNAYDGSLDAAKALHEALLPGWSVEDMSQNGRVAGHPWGIRLEKWDARVGGPVLSASAGWGYDNTPDSNPARAWLIAILKALIAEGE
jgi:hypothetical protein